jgi:N-acetylmuramoyl-L-alanine amidase
MKVIHGTKQMIALSIYLVISVFFMNVYAINNDDNKLKTVVLDAGHGGRDPGAIGLNAKEKDIALAITLKLGEYIEKNFDDVEVVYTRKKDVFVPLFKRAEIANNKNADLFISIHVNANDNTRAYGTSCHVLGLHRTKEHFEVAKRENSVILLEEDYTSTYEGFDPKSPESYIIFSLMQNLYLEQSIEFAAVVQDEFLNKAKRKDRGVIQQGLLVLARTSMPGVLIETGFITNPSEEKYLMTDYGKSIIASAIFRAFRDYKATIEERSHFAVNAEDEDVPFSKEKMNEADVEEKDVTDRETTKNKDASAQHEQAPVFPATSSSKIELRIQVLASGDQVPRDADVFEGLENIQEIKNGDTYKYTVGSSKSMDEINKLKKTITERFPDAFIIALENNEIIPIGQAIEKLKNK